MTYTQEDFERDLEAAGVTFDGVACDPRAKRIIAAYRDLVAENERLTQVANDAVGSERVAISAYLAVIQRDNWKARAEVAERVCDAASRFYDNSTCYDEQLDAALDAWEATR